MLVNVFKETLLPGEEHLDNGLYPFHRMAVMCHTKWSAVQYLFIKGVLNRPDACPRELLLVLFHCFNKLSGIYLFLLWGIPDVMLAMSVEMPLLSSR